VNETLLAALLGALAAGLGGLLVPRAIAMVPEPGPKTVAPAKDHEEDRGEDRGETGEGRAEAQTSAGDVPADEPPKMLYTEIAARPGLRGRAVAVSAVSGAVLGAATGLDWPLLWLLPLTPVAVMLSVIDWHTRLLPRLVVLPATLLATVLVVTVGLATDHREAMVRALLAMVLVRTFFWLLWWFLPGAGMGFGDVRLAALVGLVLGWVGWGAVAIGIWVGTVAFGVPGLILAIVRRDRKLMKKPFPYGPFMVFGAFVGLVWGTALSVRIWG
jgi:leader peptidase (prepilin peptidase)/N-methyltransferase